MSVELKIRPASRCGHKRGFTLTEVLVASSVLALALIPILNALTRSGRMSIQLEEKSRSLMHAQSLLEELNARAVEEYDVSWAAADLAHGQGYYSSVSDVPLGDSLRRITVETGVDHNQNQHLDGGEVMVRFQFLISRRL